MPLPSARVRVASALALGVIVASATVPGADAASSSFTMASGASTPHGLAADSTRQVYWAADPAGTNAYAYTSSGSLAGTVPLGFTPVDVEALAAHNGQVYLADIGDAKANRSKITVYRLGNPTYGQAGSYRAWDFTYPDGAHDAATLLVSPAGQMYVVTRGATAAIYKAPATPSASGTNQLTKVASAPAWVTDGTFVSSNTIALRTFNSVLLVDPYSWKTLAQEAVDGQQDGQALTRQLGSTTTLMAGSDTQVDAVQVPTTMASVSPAPSVAPAAVASASAAAASASASAAATENANVSIAKKRTGTFIALGAAACLALLAAAVVAIKR